MISTQRLVLLVIFLNLIIGFSLAVYHNPHNYDDEQISVEQDLFEYYEQDFVSEASKKSDVVASTERQYEGTFGNQMSWGKILFDVLMGGLNPISVKPDMFDTELEKILAGAITFIRFLIGIILAIEIFMVIKNKKQGG